MRTSLVLFLLALLPARGVAEDIKQTQIFQRLKETLDATPAIDTHDHPMPFELLRAQDQTPQGRGMTLHAIWQNSYYTWFNQLTPWPKSGLFEEWWPQAKADFRNARATSFYRYQLPAFTDLYGIDFDNITDAEARRVNDRISTNYLDARWFHDVVTNRSNIELMLIDPYWARLKFETSYPFEVLVFNVTTLVRGFHPSALSNPWDSPWEFGRKAGLKLETLDDYLVVLDRLFQKAKAAGAVCLKTTLAYERTLEFEPVSQAEAAKAFGRPPASLSPAERKAFEDFIMWRLVELSARYDLPFQIHTGHARIQGSNPMLLVDLIAANPKTKFILFHGGYPWIGETGAIATRFRNVWIDSVWLPTISFTMARRAYQEWLDVVPSNRIMWGADCHQAEGIYAATAVTRRVLAEALAEKVQRGELRQDHALRICRQVMRENALELFPQLRQRLWRQWTSPVDGE
ncbi:MAG: amidohydrolase family protein [Verrucomicrobiota bacterium]